MNARIVSLVTRFKTELAADRKRAALLGVLVLVFCGALGRLLVGRTEPVPLAAQASVVATVASTGRVGDASGSANPIVRPAVEETSPAVPSDDSAGIRPSDPSDSAASAPETKPLKPVEVESGPKQITRDLFASSAWSSFPVARNSSATQPAGDDEDEPGFWGRLAAGLAERGVAQRGEIDRIEKLAQELRVQATMSGSNPTAYISGRLVHIGDTIQSFSVVAIEDRSVTVALDGHHVRLRIP